jgi:uncharacterized damage-inducible protein DinB
MRDVTDIGGTGEERPMLNGFLDWYRAVVVNKVGGLSREDATRIMTPSGLSPLGVVAHLIDVEIGWFDEVFAGYPTREDLIDYGDFKIRTDDTVDSVVAQYQAACAAARKQVDAASSLDQLSVGESNMRGRVTLRWILIHMIEETARHAGHLDLMREQIDGTTGD